ncbi:hypothetical protein ACNPON_18625 [Glutamicibacter sp. AGC13]
MNLADKFSCDMPDFGSTILNCELPSAGLLEWITGIGTLLSAVAAIGLAWFTVVQSNKAVAREDEDSRRTTLEKEAELLIASAPKPLESLSDINDIGSAAVAWRNSSERYNRAAQTFGDEGVLLGNLVLRLITETSQHLANKRVLVGGIENAAVQNAIVHKLTDDEQLSENLYLSLLLETTKEDVETAVLAFARSADSEEQTKAREVLQARAKIIRKANKDRSNRGRQ